MTTFQKGQHIYFIGIGGISMSGLAEILADKGCIVSGTDIKEFPRVTKHLQNLGDSYQLRTQGGKSSRMM